TGSARSHPNSPNASPATAKPGAPSSTQPPAYHSRSAAPTASCPPGSAKPSKPATEAAAGPAAPHPPPGPTPTTSYPGGSAAPPTSTTCSYSAATTTAKSTKDTGASSSTRPPERSTSTDPTANPTNSHQAAPGSAPANRHRHRQTGTQKQRNRSSSQSPATWSWASPRIRDLSTHRSSKQFAAKGGQDGTSRQADHGYDRSGPGVRRESAPFPGWPLVPDCSLRLPPTEPGGRLLEELDRLARRAPGQRGVR